MERNNPAIGLKGEILIVALIAALLGALLLTLVFFKSAGALLAIGFVLGIFYLVSIAFYPKFGYYSFYTFTFWMFSLNLYSGLTQTGVIADGLLLLNVVTVGVVQLTKGQLERTFWRYKSLWIWTAWLLISVSINLINFQNVDWASFLYGVRRFHLNPLGFVLLNLLVIQTKKDFYQFFKISSIFLVIAFLVGYRQFYFGLNSFESALLQTEFGKTHLIQGTIRYWGVVSDSANYGILMSFYAVVFTALGVSYHRKRIKVFCFLLALFSLHHVLISGTRTAYATFGIGILIFILFYTKGFTRFYSLFFGLLTYAILRFTWIGNNLSIIRRLRTIFNSNDESLITRLDNRVLLDNWLVNQPLGGGIGGTLFDRQFRPDSFLANFPPDGLYTLLRAETGYIGEYTYNILVALVIIYMILKVRTSDPLGERRLWMVTILAITIAARLAEYAQFTTYQFPTVNLLFFLLVAFEKWESWPDRKILQPRKSAPLM